MPKFFWLICLPLGAQNWPQWGQNPQHSGSVSIVGQTPERQLADIVYDPFVHLEHADAGGALLAHYQAPLIDRTEVFMAFKTGFWVPCEPSSTEPCGSAVWNHQKWNERLLRWERGQLIEVWNFTSDWVPPPDAGGLGRWEPVFHAALDRQYIYVPGAGGSVFQLHRSDGSVAQRLSPFASPDANRFVSGPLTVDGHGNVYYNVIGLDPADPWSRDVAGAWLVHISPAGMSSAVSYSSLVPNPPFLCTQTFVFSRLPWPPTPSAVPPSGPCGSQRPGINITPAIAPDGTIYTISRAHLSSRHGYLVAVKPDLTPKWTASLRDRLRDGCAVLLPANGTPGGCRAGAAIGVDPTSNELPPGEVIDESSSSPVVAPDGSILYGAYTRYNYTRGHLFKFTPGGAFAAAYDFGWDSTPAVFAHDGTYSVIVKDNHYDAGSYCDDPKFCPTAPPGPYYITQLDSGLRPEWHFENRNTQSCFRNPDGSLHCTSDHPGGFEWCINAPAVDAHGTVYANSEDGNLYAVGQGGVLRANLFLRLSLGAAYTPLALGPDGRIYTENDGRLFVVGDGEESGAGVRY